MTEAFPWDTAPHYLLWDRDKSYGPAFRHRVRAMGITEVITVSRSPWQNPYAERLIGSIHRECLDHVIIRTSTTCAGFYLVIANIIMTPERISRSARTVHDPVPYNLPPLARSSLIPKSVAYIIYMSVAWHEIDSHLARKSFLSKDRSLIAIHQRANRFARFEFCRS